MSKKKAGKSPKPRKRRTGCCDSFRVLQARGASRLFSRLTFCGFWAGSAPIRSQRDCSPLRYTIIRGGSKERAGTTEVGTARQKLRSGAPNPGKPAFWHGRPTWTSMKKLRSEKLQADFRSLERPIVDLSLSLSIPLDLDQAERPTVELFFFFFLSLSLSLSLSERLSLLDSCSPKRQPIFQDTLCASRHYVWRTGTAPIKRNAPRIWAGMLASNQLQESLRELL